MDAVKCLMLHLRQVALPGYPLVSFGISYPIFYREFDDHMIGGGDDPYGVKGRLAQ